MAVDRCSRCGNEDAEQVMRVMTLADTLPFADDWSLFLCVKCVGVCAVGWLGIESGATDEEIYAAVTAVAAGEVKE